MDYTEKVPYSLSFYALKLKNGELSIYGRILLHRNKSEIATGIRCYPEDWDEEHAIFNPENPQSRYLLTRLREFEGKVHDAYVGIRNSGKKPDVVAMKQVITGKSNAGSPRLLDYIDDHIKLMIKKGQHSQGTLVMYRKTRDYIEQFLRSKRLKSLRLSEFRTSHIVQFEDWLLSTPNPILGRPISRVTSNKNMKNLKAMLKHAHALELIERNPFTTFKMEWPKTSMAFLSPEEVRSIAQLDLSAHKETLDEIRWCFLFSVNTGLRYSDSFGLLRSNLTTDDDGQYWMSIRQKKTRTPLSVPMFKPAVEIYLHFKEKYPDKKTVLPTYTNQFVNREIKVLCEMIGITDKRISWHTARHTYAVNMIDKGIDLFTISHFLGHSSTKSTEIYAKVPRSRAKEVAAHLSSLS
jgi:site-specific recombinase XerD